MRNSLLALSIIVLVLRMVVTTHNARAETPLVDKVENAIRSTEPEWRCTRAISNAPPPLVPGQRPLVVETWDHTMGGGKRESVEVMIFHVDSRTDAKVSLSPVREGRVATGWKVEKLRIG
jgi:predicted GTPase